MFVRWRVWCVIYHVYSMACYLCLTDTQEAAGYDEEEAEEEPVIVTTKRQKRTNEKKQTHVHDKSDDEVTVHVQSDNEDTQT